MFTVMFRDLLRRHHLKITHYFVSFINGNSRQCWVQTMKHKGEVLELFVEWKRNTEKSMGKKIKVLRSDNRGEYTSFPFLHLCRDEGIERHLTIRETPQQNGMAERINRPLLEKIRCMLFNTSLSKYFWIEALAYACCLVNKLSSSVIGSKTPLEAWSEKVAWDYDLLRVFECPTYYHAKQERRKICS